LGSAVDEDGDGHLSELVTGEGEDLGAPQRTELADGEDLAIGRPRLGCPPVAAQVTGPAFVPAQVSPGSARSSDVTVWLASGVGQGGMRRMAAFAVNHANPPGRPVTTAEIADGCQL
jgi:hypothetical protein